MNIRCKNVTFGKITLLDCEVLMTLKNSFLPVLFFNLVLNTEFLGFFLESSVCGQRRGGAFCMCFMNVLGLDFKLDFRNKLVSLSLRHQSSELST